jgi:hypothetical protein
MNFRLYREYGALNSHPVFDAFEQGLKSLGHHITNDGVPVIWSVLWNGRMAQNKAIYDNCRINLKNIIIIEVGNLRRNITWRISIGHINNLGQFANENDLDLDRPKKLGVSLKEENKNRKSEILLATQHQKSLQWQGMPPMDLWVKQTVDEIKNHTDRKIIVRPHPRSLLKLNLPNVEVEIPKQIPGTYDDFDIDYNYHCVVNHNSGPALQAAISGVPCICDLSSLAYPVSSKFEEIEKISLPDREEWFLKLCHTEWTVEEIAQGIPLKRLEPFINA